MQRSKGHQHVLSTKTFVGNRIAVRESTQTVYDRESISKQTKGNAQSKQENCRILFMQFNDVCSGGPRVDFGLEEPWLLFSSVNKLATFPLSFV